MFESSVALVGVVLEWSSSLLLLLLFYRLGRASTHRRMLWTWAAAWGGQLVAVTGFTFEAIARLTAQPHPETWSWPWLDDVYVPGTLVFMALLALAVTQAVGRRVSSAVERATVLSAIAVGVVTVLVDQRFVTGAVLVTVTGAACVGGCVRIIAAERRLRRRLVLPAGMALFGVVSLTYQSIRYLGDLLDPFGDASVTTFTAWGYASALASAILGAAVIILITEDGARARKYAEQERVRELASLLPRVGKTVEAVDRSIVMDRHPKEADYEVLPPPLEPVAVVVDQRGPLVVTVDAAPPPRAPAIFPRTATLPQPVRRPDGSTSVALLIDDEAPARSTLARIFQRGGWAVREAATGAEALSWLLDVDPLEAPAVVLCDLKMPGVGGRELHAHLQEQRPEFLQRLIFVTDGADEASSTEFIRATGCQLIHKPTSVEEVARAVERVVMEQ